VRRVIGEHIDLSANVRSGLWVAHADRGQVEQIVMNLCVNARDAMPDGGKISIALENATIDSAFCAHNAWAVEGSYVQLSVTDTGSGMPSEVIEHVFEPFYTTKAAGKGTGLGLATVYGIVRQHDGLIHLHSEVGRGTTFQVYLPIAKAFGPKAAAETRAPSADGGSELILVAEDDELVRELTVQTLEKAGYRLVVARDGAEAVELFEDRAEEIAMAILDVMMPKKNGRVVLDEIHKLRPGLPALFISGYSSEALESTTIPDDSYELLEKPFGHTDLLGKVREHIEASQGDANRAQ
jgi:two-component system, cell cycle sensor histidine kinase and response regulator CckA